MGTGLNKENDIKESTLQNMRIDLKWGDLDQIRVLGRNPKGKKMTLKAFEALNMGLGKSLVCMQNNIPVLVSAPTLLSLSEQLRITQGGSRRKPLARWPVAQGN